MKRITNEAVWNFWIREIQKSPTDYIDCGEFNTTAMGESAAQHFDCMTDEGKSPIEQDIFDWAVDFSNAKTVNEFI